MVGTKHILFLMLIPIFGRGFGTHCENDTKFVRNIMCSKCGASEILRFFVNKSISQKTQLWHKRIWGNNILAVNTRITKVNIFLSLSLKCSMFKMRQILHSVFKI